MYMETCTAEVGKNPGMAYKRPPPTMPPRCLRRTGEDTNRLVDDNHGELLAPDKSMGRGMLILRTRSKKP